MEEQDVKQRAAIRFADLRAGLVSLFWSVRLIFVAFERAPGNLLMADPFALYVYCIFNSDAGDIQRHCAESVHAVFQLD